MHPEHDTHKRILDTAIDLIWENSYGSVSVDDICEKADVRKGSFYHFFPSKSELTVAAFNRHWEEKQTNYDRIFSVQYSPEERFDKFAEYIYNSQLEKKRRFGKLCGCPYASIGSELGTQDEKIRLLAEGNAQRSIKYFEAALRDAAAGGSIPSEDLKSRASQIYSFVIGVMIQAKIENSAEPLLSLRAGLFRLIGFPNESLAGAKDRAG